MTHTDTSAQRESDRLTALSRRVSTAPVNSDELDCEIHQVLGWTRHTWLVDAPEWQAGSFQEDGRWVRRNWCWIPRDLEDRYERKFGGRAKFSICRDWWIEASQNYSEDGYETPLYTYSIDSAAEIVAPASVWSCGVDRKTGPWAQVGMVKVQANSVPLALAAAALLDRASVPTTRRHTHAFYEDGPQGSPVHIGTPPGANGPRGPDGLSSYQKFKEQFGQQTRVRQPGPFELELVQDTAKVLELSIPDGFPCDSERKPTEPLDGWEDSA